MFFAGSRRRRVVVDLQDRDKDGKIIRLVKQADKDAVDIRNIVKRFTKLGMLSHVRMNQGFYADISEAPTFLQALNVVAVAQQQFEALPSALRDRFNNDPAKFMAFVHDPANKDELVKLGLREKEAVPPPPPEPMAVRIVSDAPVSK